MPTDALINVNGDSVQPLHQGTEIHGAFLLRSLGRGGRLPVFPLLPGQLSQQGQPSGAAAQQQAPLAGLDYQHGLVPACRDTVHHLELASPGS